MSLLEVLGKNRGRGALTLKTPRPRMKQRMILRFIGNEVRMMMGMGIKKSNRSVPMLQAVANIKWL